VTGWLANNYPRPSISSKDSQLRNSLFEKTSFNAELVVREARKSCKAWDTQNNFIS
jgi:hypothetical protein